MESKLVIIVNDKGRGIKKKDQENTVKLMPGQKFVSLYVSKCITKLAKGDIDFISTWKKGSTFIISYQIEVDAKMENMKGGSTFNKMKSSADFGDLQQSSNSDRDQKTNV